MSEQHPPLMYAIDDPTIFEQLLRAGADPHTCITDYDKTLLMVAAQLGHRDTAALLLEFGVDVGHTNQFGWDAWMHATSSQQHELARWLVDSHGARERDMRFMELFNTGISDGEVQRVEVYLREDGDPNACLASGWTLLMQAAAWDQQPILRLLLEAGADHVALTADARSALTAAANHGHLAIIEHLFEVGAPANQRPGYSPALAYAALGGHPAAMGRLLDAGAHVDSPDAKGITPLMYAALDGDEAMTRRLVAMGADLDVVTPDGITALMYAAQKLRVAVVKQLVEAGADLELRANTERGGFNATVLHRVCDNSRKTNPQYAEIVEILVEGGADPRALNRYGHTPLDTARSARMNGCESVLVDLLTTRPLAALRAKHGLSDAESLPPELYPELCERQTTLSLLEWIRAGQSELVIGMLEAGLYDRLRPLHRLPLSEAVEFGSLVVVSALLEAGADPNETPLHGYAALPKAARMGDLKIVARLLEGGADPDGPSTSDSLSPLAHAARYNHVDCMQCLIDAGATIDLAPAGNSPVYWAAYEGSREAVTWLLARGAATEVRSRQGHTALIAAAERGCQEIVQMLLEAGAAIDAKGLDGESPLIKACKNGSTDVGRLLVDAGLDVNSDAGQRVTALGRAASLDKIEWIDFLLEAGADVHVRDERGQTPLHLAVSAKSVNAIARLLQAGANPFENTANDYTALDYALDGGNREVIRLIRGAAQ